MSWGTRQQAAGLPWERLQEGGHHKARSTCVQCPAMGFVSLRAHLPSDVILKKFKQQGWEEKKGGLICPACAAVRPTPRLVVVQETQTDMPNPSPTAPAAAASLPAGRVPTMKESRLIMGKLEEVFNDKNCQYAVGWSDQRVSDDLNIPRALIVSIRREAFGEVRPPPELTNLKVEIDAVKDMVNQIDRRVEKALKAWGS